MSDKLYGSPERPEQVELGSSDGGSTPPHLDSDASIGDDSEYQLPYYNTHQNHRHQEYLGTVPPYPMQQQLTVPPGAYGSRLGDEITTIHSNHNVGTVKSSAQPSIGRQGAKRGLWSRSVEFIGGPNFPGLSFPPPLPGGSLNRRGRLGVGAAKIPRHTYQSASHQRTAHKDARRTTDEQDALRDANLDTQRWLEQKAREKKPMPIPPLQAPYRFDWGDLPDKATEEDVELTPEQTDIFKHPVAYPPIYRTRRVQPAAGPVMSPYAGPSMAQAGADITGTFDAPEGEPRNPLAPARDWFTQAWRPSPENLQSFSYVYDTLRSQGIIHNEDPASHRTQNFDGQQRRPAPMERGTPVFVPLGAPPMNPLYFDRGYIRGGSLSGTTAGTYYATHEWDEAGNIRLLNGGVYFTRRSQLEQVVESDDDEEYIPESEREKSSRGKKQQKRNR